VGIGLGFVLNGDGIVCLDVDQCLDERGRLTQGAAALLDLAGTTYVEVSPSGKGLHVWGRAELTQGRRVSFRGQSVELYPSGRYMTVTGKRYLGSLSVLGDVSAAVAAALDEP
jgi:primase-polymerase (primpol)-like protein